MRTAEYDAQNTEYRTRAKKSRTWSLHVISSKASKSGDATRLSNTVITWSLVTSICSEDEQLIETKGARKEGGKKGIGKVRLGGWKVKYRMNEGVRRRKIREKR